jgi:hypothetical protein
MLSSRITTFFLCSTRRLAFSMTISATWTWRSAGSSKVELITSRFTDRCMSVTSSGRSSMSSTNKHDILVVLGTMLLAMHCSSMVLPERGGDTISPRWPKPMGVSRSMIRAE